MPEIMAHERLTGKYSAEPGGRQRGADYFRRRGRMPRKDEETIGFAGNLVCRVRYGRRRGLEKLAAAKVFEPVLDALITLAALKEDDNVLLLGVLDQRPVAAIAPACLRLTSVDDLDFPELNRMEEEWSAKGFKKVQFQQGSGARFPAPQGTIDKLIAINWMFRCPDPFTLMRNVEWVSHHDCKVVFCEPSVSLDQRTARKYSREAELSMEDHDALVRYAATAVAHRRFTREGLQAILSRWKIRDVQVTELLHGLVLAATGTVQF